jgi:hypothetical protein
VISVSFSSRLARRRAIPLPFEHKCIDVSPEAVKCVFWMACGPAIDERNFLEVSLGRMPADSSGHKVVSLKKMNPALE